MRWTIAIASLILGTTLFACTAEAPQESKGDQPKRHAVSTTGGDAAGHAHARTTRLGAVADRYAVTQMGNPAPGAELAFVVTPLDDRMIDADARLQAWLETDARTAASPRVTAPLTGDSHHFHLTAAKGQAAPAVLALLPAGAKDEAALRVALAPGWGPHDGVLAVLRAGQKIAGLVEVKLHDDKGDLEMWLTDSAGKPLDLALDTVVRLTFIDREQQTVELRVRNQEKNEGEDGLANVRAGKTNYFIFPGATGADAAWLTGADFEGNALLVIKLGDKVLLTLPFTLVPHTHAGGHGHDHEHGSEKTEHTEKTEQGEHAEKTEHTEHTPEK